MKQKTKKKYERPAEKPFIGVPAGLEAEFSTAFVQGMADRMAVSFYKYGPVAEAYPDKVDALRSLKQRLDLYFKGGEVKGKKIEPGNTEYLIDAANFCMIEFMRPRHPKAHFKATDSDGSPGRVWNDGRTTAAGHGEEQKAEAVHDFYSKRRE